MNMFTRNTRFAKAREQQSVRVADKQNNKK